MSSCARHNACVSQALLHAETVCQKAGGRLTKTRRQVLELLWQTHQPRKAYDVLRDLSAVDASAKPPTVYRALDFLLQMGLAHKVESLDAYVGCNGSHDHQYLICNACGTVADISDAALSGQLTAAARMKKFNVEKTIVEIKGHCERCAA
jgi:Fur family zinc uptake transcriptional regulator